MLEERTRVPDAVERPDTTAAHACRFCGHARTRPVGTVDGYAFNECPACAFTFAPALTPAHLATLYESGYHGVEEGAPESGWSTDEPEFLAAALERLDDGPLRILDFGTGQSRTPDALRAHGHHVTAVDVAPPAPGREHPHRVTGDLITLDLPASGFDLAFAFQVFEHLPEPRAYLDRLLALTRPGGLVLVHTDMETPERARDGFEAWWYVLPPDHCAFYRHRTFEAYCDGTPHRVVFKDEKRVVIEKRTP